MWDKLYTNKVDYDNFIEKEIFRLVENKRKCNIHQRKKAEAMAGIGQATTSAGTNNGVDIVWMESGAKIEDDWGEWISIEAIEFCFCPLI